MGKKKPARIKKVKSFQSLLNKIDELKSMKIITKQIENQK